MKVHHIGYLVKNMEKAKKIFEQLGFEDNSDDGISVYDDYRKIDILFMKNGDYMIELILPKTEDSVVMDLRKKLGCMPYHMCYEVENIADSINELRKLHFVIWEEPHEAPAFNNRKVCFLINSQVGIIELLENSCS